MGIYIIRLEITPNLDQKNVHLSISINSICFFVKFPLPIGGLGVFWA